MRSWVVAVALLGLLLPLAAQQADGKSKAKADEADADTGERKKITAPTDRDSVVSIYPAARADAVPGCEKKPGKKEKTVILVSQRISAPSRP